jgi:hypothetical protein
MPKMRPHKTQYQYGFSQIHWVFARFSLGKNTQNNTTFFHRKFAQNSSLSEQKTGEENQ